MTNVVYVIEGTKCAIQYVGETEIVLHIRMNSHRSDIKNQRLGKPLAKPLNSIDHSLDDLSGFIVEEIHQEDSLLCKAMESYWITLLWSLAPEGLNLDP